VVLHKGWFCPPARGSPSASADDFSHHTWAGPGDAAEAPESVAPDVTVSGL
jgi:hypothetical protein